MDTTIMLTFVNGDNLLSVKDIINAALPDSELGPSRKVAI